MPDSLLMQRDRRSRAVALRRAAIPLLNLAALPDPWQCAGADAPAAIPCISGRNDRTARQIILHYAIRYTMIDVDRSGFIKPDSYDQ